MTSKFLRLFLATAVILTISALAQTSSAATPSGPAATPAAAAPIVMTGTKVGAISIEGALFGCNEGRRDLEALLKKFEPKQNDLKTQNDELDALKKQLNTQGPSLNEEAAANLKKQIESKQKLFDRAVQDAQEDFGTQRQEIASRILQKMAPMIGKYAQDNGYGMIIDTSRQWPESPVLMAGAGLDITPAVVDLYNVQSGVAAPAPTGAARPAAKPSTGTTTKPAVPATPAPTTPKN
jgi:outer membrane protein